MAIDLSSEKTIYDGIREHAGHKIVVAKYAKENATIECETCGCVLLSGDNEPKKKGKKPKEVVIVSLSTTEGVSVQGPYEDEQEAEEAREDEFDNNSGRVNLIVELERP